MMSNKIFNLIVFEIFAPDHEYLCLCVYRILMWFARHPCSTSLSVGNYGDHLILNVRSNSHIVSRENARCPPCTDRMVACRAAVPVTFHWCSNDVVDRLHTWCNVHYWIKNLCSLCCRMYSSVQMSLLSRQSFSIPRWSHEVLGGCLEWKKSLSLASCQWFIWNNL